MEQKMKKYLIFCKNCISKPENEYYHAWAGEFIWEGEKIGRSFFRCSKCRKEFEVKEKMFIPKSESEEKLRE